MIKSLILTHRTVKGASGFKLAIIDRKQQLTHPTNTNNEERAFYELLDEFLKRDSHSGVGQVKEKVGNAKAG